MSLNETMERLRATMGKIEAERAAAAAMTEETDGDARQIAEMLKASREQKAINQLAEQIFFSRMLKEINQGMSVPKIDAMIDRAVLIATRLYNKLYK